MSQSTEPTDKMVEAAAEALYDKDIARSDLARDVARRVLQAALPLLPLSQENQRLREEVEGLRRENELLRRVANAAERGITRGECGPCDYGLMMGCSCNEMDKALAALSPPPPQ